MKRGECIKTLNVVNSHVALVSATAFVEKYIHKIYEIRMYIYFHARKEIYLILKLIPRRVAILEKLLRLTLHFYYRIETRDRRVPL